MAILYILTIIAPKLPFLSLIHTKRPSQLFIRAQWLSTGSKGLSPLVGVKQSHVKENTSKQSKADSCPMTINQPLSSPDGCNQIDS